MRTTVERDPSLRWWGAWPGLAAMALLGSSVAVIAATQHLPVLGLQAARYGVTAITLIVLARAFGVRLVLPRRADIGWVIGGALTGLVGFNLATIVGTRHAEPGLLGAAVAGIPIVLAISGALLLRTRPAATVVGGAAIVGLGAVAVTGWGRGDAVGLLMAGALIACEVGLTLCGAQALPRMGAWSYSAATAVVAAVIFAVLSAIFEPLSPTAYADPQVIGAVLYLGAVATALAFVLWFTGVQRLGPSRVGLCAGTAAPAAALIGSVFGAPLPSVGAWLGMAVIAVGLLVGFAPRTNPPATGADHGEETARVAVSSP